MYAFQNGFHPEKGHILFLEFGISALGHQMPRLVTIMYIPDRVGRCISVWVYNQGHNYGLL